MAAMAAVSSARIASARTSEMGSLGRMPLMTRWVAWTPASASSSAVRDASASDELCGRATRPSLVTDGSARAVSASA